MKVKSVKNRQQVLIEAEKLTVINGHFKLNELLRKYKVGNDFGTTAIRMGVILVEGSGASKKARYNRSNMPTTSLVKKIILQEGVSRMSAKKELPKSDVRTKRKYTKRTPIEKKSDVGLIRKFFRFIW